MILQNKRLALHPFALLLFDMLILFNFCYGIADMYVHVPKVCDDITWSFISNDV